MSGLEELNLTLAIEKQLERKQWTIEKLATADPAELIRFKGVGKKTAQEIVSKAQEIVNQVKLEESQYLDPMPDLEPLVMNEADEPAHLSVRQRRILASFEKRQKEEE